MELASDKETAAATLAPDREAGLGHGGESGPMCRFKLREEEGGACYGSDHGANPMDKEANELGKKAKELKKASEALHQEERSGNKGRKWRKNMKAVEKVCLPFKPIVGDIPRGVTRWMYDPTGAWRLIGDPPGAWQFTDNPPNLGNSLITRRVGQKDNKA
ncbi:hypothetical protein ACQJBY_044359 [Aegilops geniculata]